MADTTDERMFDEEEVAAILEHATTSKSSSSGGTGLARPSGITLTELQDIGAEVGIDPERIASAARAVTTPSAVAVGAPRTFLGTRRSVSRTVPIRGPLSEEEWARVVAEIRQTFGAQGTIESHGALRSWSNGNLQVHVEPDADGYRLRMQTFKGNAASLAGMGAALFGMGTLGVVATVTSPFLELGPLLVSGLIAAGGLTQVAAVRALLPRWAAERERQMASLAERIPLLLDSVED